MQYGFFDLKEKEYVITRPDTPLPWINYLGCEEYCGLMSNTGGGYSFYKDPRERRLLRYRYNNIPTDRGGRYLYIRDNETKKFFSPTWQPTCQIPVSKFQAGEEKGEDMNYECRHGLGYTSVSSEYLSLKAKITYFVPLSENLEIWQMEIKNLSDQSRDLSIFSFVEFCFWDALNDMTDYQYNLNIGETEHIDGIIYHLSRVRTGQNYFAYFACSNKKIAGFDGERTGFLGPYGSLSSPRAVVEGKCSNSIACGWAPVGAHQINVKLEPDETKTLIFIVGYSEDREDVKRVLSKYQTPEAVSEELSKLRKYWEHNLEKFQVQTEDEDLNVMVNVWNQYQCRTTFNWSRSASYYESGIGRGMGFRDSNQDTLGFVHMIPEKVKQRIIDLASNQFKKGDAYHQYSPLTKEGNGGGYSDDHLWLIISTVSYIKETGDIKFLDEKIPFADGSSSSLYDHLKKAIDFSLHNVGPHGIPKMFFADWNDCLNIEGDKGESVMVAEMFVHGANELSILAEKKGAKGDVKKFKQLAEEMKKKINDAAWDGAWYVRAFTDDKEPVGSSKNKEGRIYLETQPWAVISGVADGERAEKCMDSVKKHLASEHGVLILDPPYLEYHPELGSISIYPPGLKENGAIFCHPNPWAMIAECILGRGNQAYKYYKAIHPAARNKIAEIHKVEPYVYCQMIAGREHKDFGEGKNSWLTGSACWNFVAVSQHILGIRADYDGLLVDPCIPDTWKGFEAKRKFRESNYYITVRNPEGVCKGVKSVTVDGKKIKGNVIPPFDDRKDHHVEVIMGKVK